MAQQLQLPASSDAAHGHLDLRAPEPGAAPEDAPAVGKLAAAARVEAVRERVRRRDREARQLQLELQAHPRWL